MPRFFHKMNLVLKKINTILKKNNIHLLLTLSYFLNIFKSLKNYIKILVNSNLDSIYIPNLAIKNIININPNKIKYVNSIPLKFNKSTKFILNFDWDKKNRVLKTDLHPSYVTCHELFVIGKKIEKCKNYFYFKDQIREKNIYKNCKNHNDIIKFFEKKIKLFKSIKKLGVKKNLLFNIQFMIDRNFNLVKINSGNHRMAISRILGIKKIPIEIKVIHTQCFNQNTNDKIHIKKINEVIKNIEKKYT